MSFARWSDESDVYVFGTMRGDQEVIECCSCSLRNLLSFQCSTNAEMVAHLQQHIAAGDMVPDYTIPALLESDWGGQS